MRVPSYWVCVWDICMLALKASIGFPVKSFLSLKRRMAILIIQFLTTLVGGFASTDRAIMLKASLKLRFSELRRKRSPRMLELARVIVAEATSCEETKPLVPAGYTGTPA